jgi:hypothetical protein
LPPDGSRGCPARSGGPGAVRPFGCGLLLGEQPQGQVDALDLTGPAFVLGAVAPVTQIPFQFDQTRQHLRIDVQHRASDAPLTELTTA